MEFVRVSPIAVDTAGDIRPLKPLETIDPPSDWVWYGVNFLLIVAIIILVFVWYRRRKKTGKPILTPIKRDVTWVLLALKGLQEKEASSKNGSKELCKKLRAILNAYLGARYALKADYLTTQELLNAVGRTLEGSVFAQLADLLYRLDTAIYARHPHFVTTDTPIDETRAVVERIDGNE